MSFPRLLGATLVLLISLPASGGSLTVSATGLGPDAGAAAARALEHAATRALGVAATLDPAFTDHARKWVSRHGAETGSWSGEPDQQWSALEALSAFRVLGRETVNKHLQRAEVEIRFQAERKSPTRLSPILVAPFHTADASYTVGSEIPAREVRDQIKRHLETVFAQSGQVSVREKAIEGTASSPAEQIRRGRELGADFVLVGSIDTFALTTQASKHMGMKLRTLQPRAVIQYQILNTVTREMVRAGTFSDRKLPKSLKQAFADDEINPAEEPGRVGEILYPRVARALASEVMETLFPLRVLAAASKDRVLIDAGQGRLREGDLLSAHRIERQVRDPEINLGVRMETAPLGTVSVTSVRADHARGRLVTGELKDLDRGTFLRIQARPEGDQGKASGSITAPGARERDR